MKVEKWMWGYGCWEMTFHFNSLVLSSFLSVDLHILSTAYSRETLLSQRIEENDEAIVQLLTYIGTGNKKTVTKSKNPPNPFDMTAIPCVTASLLPVLRFRPFILIF